MGDIILNLVALITPFNEMNQVNYDKLRELLKMHIENNNTDGIILLGTTSESPTLSYEEKIRIISYTLGYVQRRKPIYLGVSFNNLDSALEWISLNDSKDGIDGYLLLTPFYNKASEEGLFEYFKQIANKTNKDIILYNVPSRTGVNISINNLKRLKDIKNIKGIKEATRDVDRIRRIAEITDEGFGLYIGDDYMILEGLLYRAKGIISVINNANPLYLKRIIEQFESNNLTEALKEYYKILPLLDAVYNEVNPIGIKEWMNINGMEVGNPRIPLSDANKETKNLLKHSLKLTRLC